VRLLPPDGELDALHHVGGCRGNLQGGNAFSEEPGKAELAVALFDDSVALHTMRGSDDCTAAQ
jgi:hypothetical protein